MSATPLKQPVAAFDEAHIARHLRAVMAAMRDRFLSDDWPAADIDLLFAHYLFGFILEALPDSAAEPRLAWLIRIGGEVLAPDDLDRAIHRTRPPQGSGLHRLADLFERVGRRDAVSMSERAVLKGPDFGRLERETDSSVPFGGVRPALPPVLTLVGGTGVAPLSNADHADHCVSSKI